MSARQIIAVLACGMLFGFGLALSTMISPEIVLAFLRWRDLGLMLVLGGAVAVTLAAYQGAPRLMKQPLLGGQFHLRSGKLDRATIVGAAIFGVGWGICGVCPGPAIAGLGAGNFAALYALGGIFAGAWLQGLWSDRRARAAAEAART